VDRQSFLAVNPHLQNKFKIILRIGSEAVWFQKGGANEEWIVTFVNSFALCLLAISMAPHQKDTDKSVPDEQKSTAQNFIIIARLSTPLVAGKAKVGDRVAAKITAVATANEIFSPYSWGAIQVNGDVRKRGKMRSEKMGLAGAVLMGRITQSERRSESQSESRLGFTFEEIQPRDGKRLPFRAPVAKVEPYYTEYQSIFDVHRDCEHWDVSGHCTEESAVVHPDFYDLENVSIRSDGISGILLSSTKHEIKLGPNIQIQLRLPEDLNGRGNSAFDEADGHR
jgi:hypothetical protein